MALTTTEISEKLNEQQLIQIACNRKLHEGIISDSPQAIDDALANGADSNEPVILQNGKKSTRPPLMTAVYYASSYAVKKLIQYKANIFLVESDQAPLFLRAVKVGDSEIVNEFLKAGINVNTYFEMSALSQSILSLSAIALIYQDTRWSSTTNENPDAIQTKIENWYNDASTILPNGVFKVKYFGDISTITLLLKNINIYTADVDGITPLMLCQTPEKFIASFIAVNNEKALQFISDQNHVLTFQRTMTSRNLKKKLEVIVEYDLSEIQLLIQARIAAEQSSRVAEVEGHIKTELAQINTKVTPMHQLHQANAEREAKIAAILAAPGGRGAFYTALSHGLNNILLAFKTLESKMVKREQYSTADTCADIINLLSDHVPAPFGTATALLAAIVQKISDITEENKHKRVTRRVELDHAPLCRDFALAITELYKDRLTLCTDATAERMAKEAITTALVCLNDDAFDSTKPVLEQLKTAVVTSNQFNTRLDTLLLKQSKQAQQQRPQIAGRVKKQEKCALM